MVDEHSETQDTLAWTGTLATGEPALGSEFCEDWDDDSGLLKFGGVGVSASSYPGATETEMLPALMSR